jgi:hypothetical protein
MQIYFDRIQRLEASLLHSRPCVTPPFDPYIPLDTSCVYIIVVIAVLIAHLTEW